MKTALMLCYYFPPVAGGGVQRSVKFAKYLPGCEWKPVIVTGRPERRVLLEQGRDDTLIPDIPTQAEVIRTRSLEYSLLYALLSRLRLRKALFELEQAIPMLAQDYKIGWYPTALAAGRRRLHRAPVDVIYSTSVPYSAHLVGRILSRQFRIPWVADFRDSWTEGHRYRPRSRVQALIDVRLEAGLVGSADAIIANTPTNKELLCRSFGVSSQKVSVIRNGFDPADFSGHTCSESSTSRFEISCIGKFYDMVNPRIFFEAYSRFHDMHPEAFLRLIGPRGRAVRQAAKDILTNGSWQECDRVNHDTALTIMRTSAVLLANVPCAEDTNWIPGKLYEYIAARRPILFIGPTVGDAAAIIRHTNSGVVVPNSYSDIMESLRRFYRAWLAGHAHLAERPSPNCYDRPSQTLRLATIFERLLTRRGTTLTR